MSDTLNFNYIGGSINQPEKYNQKRDFNFSVSGNQEKLQSKQIYHVTENTTEKDLLISQLRNQITILQMNQKEFELLTINHQKLLFEYVFYVVIICYLKVKESLNLKIKVLLNKIKFLSKNTKK